MPGKWAGKRKGARKGARKGSRWYGTKKRGQGLVRRRGKRGKKK